MKGDSVQSRPSEEGVNERRRRPESTLFWVLTPKKAPSKVTL